MKPPEGYPHHAAGPRRTGMTRWRSWPIRRAILAFQLVRLLPFVLASAGGAGPADHPHRAPQLQVVQAAVGANLQVHRAVRAGREPADTCAVGVELPDPTVTEIREEVVALVLRRG